MKRQFKFLLILQQSESWLLNCAEWVIHVMLREHISMSKTPFCHKTVAYLALNKMSNRISLRHLLKTPWHTKYFATNNCIEKTPQKTHSYISYKVYRQKTNKQTKKDFPDLF